MKLKKTILLTLAAISVCATALAYTETWYVWECVNCGARGETNYNRVPGPSSRIGSEACPYDRIRGHRLRCIGTKQIEV